MQRAAALLVLIVPLAGLGLANVTVDQLNRAFSVATVTIARGGTIKFANEDEFNHQIYIESAAFSYESEEQSPGQTIAVVFTKNGTFEVKCHIHPKMHLTVDVVDPD